MDEQLKKKIIDHYQKGEGSIQDIARVYRVSMDEVLDVLDLNDIKTVTTRGDLIDQEEAGMDVQLVPQKTFKVPYTTD